MSEHQNHRTEQREDSTWLSRPTATFVALATAILVALAVGCGDNGGGPGDNGGDPGDNGGDPGDNGGDPGENGGDPGDNGGDLGCGDIVTFEDGKSPSRILYVSTAGSDSTGDGSDGSPYATIGRAASAATPGTAVRVLPGTYAGNSFISGLHGSAEAPIWIGGVPGEEKPLIQGGGNGLHLVRPRYVIVHNLEVAGATGNGINCDDGGDVANDQAARHVVFRDLLIRDIGTSGNRDCLKLSGVREFFVLDSEIKRCTGESIDMVGCHNGIIARNHIEEDAGLGLQTKGGSANIEIRQNRLVRSVNRSLNMGGNTGKSFFRPPLSTTEPNAEARNIRAFSNVFIGGAAPLVFEACVECMAVNNTFINPAPRFLRILQSTFSDDTHEFLPARDGVVANNLVYYDSSLINQWSFINVGSNTEAETFVFANNLWYAYDDPSRSRPTLPSEETGGIAGIDPLVDRTAVHPEPASGSPAIGTGTSDWMPPADFRGQCFGSPPTIGAYEVER